MIKLPGMALQARLDLAQPFCAAKLRQKNRDQVRSALDSPRVRIGTMLLHKLIEPGPRNLL